MKNPENKNCRGGDSCCGGNNKTAAARETACCGSSDAACDCHDSFSSSKGRMRTIIGSVVLVAAALLVARAIAKDSGASSTTDTQAQAFVMPVAAPASPAAAGAVIGTQIDSFADLNRLAAQTDAVFLFLPDKNGKLPSDAVKGAAAKIEKQGQKCGLFTLKTSSPDFGQLTSQATLPAVLVMVKGKGTIWVSGDITEEKLAQGFVAASRAAGCCSGGGCCP